MFNILPNITLRSITIAGAAVVIYLCTSCRNNHAEVERIIRNHLEPTKELYALTLQTGEVTLPFGGKYPHVTYLAPGGTETPINNVWIVNGNYMGKIYGCHGYDLYMKCYQDAGLIIYNVACRDSTSVRNAVCLTEKGKQYLVGRYIFGFHPTINVWRRREQPEVVLVAKEKFDSEIYPSDTTGIYHCKVHRKLEITPFIEALGATGKENQPNYACRLRVGPNNKEYPMVVYIGMEP